MIVHNPTDNDVKDYPIQDPKTGEVKMWGILRGETLDFPDYVGSYLVEVYGFLQRVITQEQLDEEQRMEQAKAKGKHFERIKIVPSGGLTNEIAQTPPLTPEELKPKATQAAVSTEVASKPVLNREPNKGIICPKCSHTFQNKAAMKTHYAHNHLTIPGID